MLSLPEIRAARSVLVFASFGSEIPTEGLIRRLAEDAVLSRRLFLPALTPEDMVALPYRPGDSLLRASYGPLEPAAGAPADPREFDAVIAPGLAFDRDGYRLGHGGGHFDRYLAALRPDAARIGVAFALQIVDEVPHGARDEPLDVVVTDQETFRCGRR